MSTSPANIHTKLSDTLTFTHCANPRMVDYGFWLYDDTRGFNIAMRDKTERDAFVGALTYYQERLTEVEAAHNALKSKVDMFVDQFTESNDD